MTGTRLTSSTSVSKAQQPSASISKEFHNISSLPVKWYLRNYITKWENLQRSFAVFEKYKGNFFIFVPYQGKQPTALAPPLGWCSAQRIKIAMIASGNHTKMYQVAKIY